MTERLSPRAWCASISASGRHARNGKPELDFSASMISANSSAMPARSSVYWEQKIRGSERTPTTPEQRAEIRLLGAAEPELQNQWGDGVAPGTVETAGAAVGPVLVGFHSLASFRALAIWSGVIFFSSSSLKTAASRSPPLAASVNHMSACS